uniref:Uncharacterized protein n=1 Tax=Marseillevirus LCMAC102 TaxID=2506603 RepID=A0A481YUZ7_9VIRU|nr:MAG: hypothetical protein LCMAC102_04210 [Marseillevirus LCMAC102]
MSENLYIVSEDGRDSESCCIFYSEYFLTEKEAKKRVAELTFYDCECHNPEEDNPEDCDCRSWFVYKTKLGKTNKTHY